MAHIYDFAPYFYVPAPRGFTADDSEGLMNHLNVRYGSFANQVRFIELTPWLKTQMDGKVVQIDIVKRKSLMGYLGEDLVPFIRIAVDTPRTVPKARDEFIFVVIGDDLILTSFLISTHLRTVRLLVFRLVQSSNTDV